MIRSTEVMTLSGIFGGRSGKLGPRSGNAGGRSGSAGGRSGGKVGPTPSAACRSVKCFMDCSLRFGLHL